MMGKLYLISGFLGSGKTTFLKNFIRLFNGKTVSLIINEFGKEGVDGTLLADLSKYLLEIAGGSVFCSCRMDQFEAALRECIKMQSEIILVESSGLSDPTGVRSLFTRTDRFSDIQYMGSICIIDAIRFPKLYEVSRTCVKQLAASDIAIINKTDIASHEQLNNTRNIVEGQRPDITLFETSFGIIDPDILSFLEYRTDGGTSELPLTADLTLRRLTIRISSEISVYELEMFIQSFAENTFRVKGFINTKDKGITFVDCVGSYVNITEYPNVVAEEKIGNLTVLSGAKMPVRKAVSDACKWYKKYIVSVEY